VRWPEHCCPERAQRGRGCPARAPRPLGCVNAQERSRGDFSTELLRTRRVVSRVLGFRARRGVRDGRRTRGVGAIFFSVLFFGLQTAPNRHKGNPARAPAGPTLRPFPLRPDRSIAPPGFRWRRAGPGDPNSDRIGGTSVVPRGRRIHARAARTTAYRAACGQHSHARRFACRFVMCGKPADRVARSRSGRHEHTRTHANSHKGNAPRRRRRRRAYERFVSATPRGHRARADTNTPRRGRAGQPRRLGT